MHILPKGYTRSRSYGGFHGPQRRDYLELCRQLLGITEPEAEQASEPLELVEWKLPTCERCQAGDGIDLVIGASKLERCLQVRRLLRALRLRSDPALYVRPPGGSFDWRIWIVFRCVRTFQPCNKSLSPQPIAIEVRHVTAKCPKSLPIRALDGLSLLFQANETCCQAVMIGRLSGTYRRFQRLESA